MSEVICKECGAKIPDGVMACPNCGCPVRDDKVQCEECDRFYDADLMACPNCGCPNARIAPSLRQAVADQEKRELNDLAMEKKRLYTQGSLASPSNQASGSSHRRHTSLKSLLTPAPSHAEIPLDKDPSRSIIQTMKRILANGLNFHGRARRSEFWLFVIINVIIGYLIYMLVFYSIGRDYILVSEAPTAGLYWSSLIYCCLGRHTIVTLIALAYVVLMALPGVSLTVRRLHDTNRSGWWIMLAVAGWALGRLLGFSPWIGALLLSLMLLLDSVPDNKWGKRYGYDFTAKEKGLATDKKNNV